MFLDHSKNDVYWFHWPQGAWNNRIGVLLVVYFRTMPTGK